MADVSISKSSVIKSIRCYVRRLRLSLISAFYPNTKEIFLKHLRVIEGWKNDNRPYITPLEFLNVQVRIARDIKKLEKIKHSLKKLGEDIATPSYEIRVLKVLGDTLAWNLFTEYWIRQQCKHLNHGGGRDLIHNPGFDWEVHEAKEAARRHDFVILNEITNCLNIGDLSIYKEGGVPDTREVKFKMTPDTEKRLQRQLTRIKNLYTLLGEKAELQPPDLNQTFMGYPDNMTLIRAKPLKKFRDISKRHYADELNTILWEVRSDGQSRFATFDNITGYKVLKVSVENALQMTRNPSIDRDIQGFLTGDRKGMVTSIDIYERYTDYPEVPPLTTLFDAEIATDLIFGDLMLITIIHGGRMADYLADKGVVVDESPENYYWRTGVYKVGGRASFFHQPFKRVMWAVHSTDYLATVCLDAHEQHENSMREIMGRYPGGTPVYFDFKLDKNGTLQMSEIPPENKKPAPDSNP